MKLDWKSRRFAAMVLLTAFVAGCETVPRERDAAVDLYAKGRYEEALGQLNAGLVKHPNDSYLINTQARMRVEISSRLIVQANAQRELSHYDEAEALLSRASYLDPANARVKSLLLDVARDKRMDAILQEAQTAADKKQLAKSLAFVERGLKDSPRHSGLLTLQRKLELEQRQAREAQDGRLADSRPITLEFRDAPVRAVLDVVGRSSGVNFIFDKDVKNDLRTTVFLKQARIEDALELIASTNQLAIKVLNAKTVLIYPNTADKNKEYQDLVVRVFYLAHADVKQTAAALKGMLKLRDAQVDERLNTIMIRETADTVRLAERIVALQDVPDAEVVLDVSVMEISTSRLTELGIKPPTGFSLSVLPLTDQSALTVSSLNSVNGSRIGVGLGSAQINLRGESGDVNTLANPKIRVKNREKAKILIGDKIPIISSSTNTTSNFVTENIQYQDVGLKLEVEPSITLDDEVQIKIGLEVSSLGKEVRTTNSVAYQIGTRTANTVLKLHDGETQVLAGLISKEDRSSVAGLPWLSEAPIVGRLFGSHLDNGQQTEIVLAITPRVVRNVRRPDINQTEFWSGSETRIRMRPLALPEDASAPAASSQAGPGPAAGAPSIDGGLPPGAAPVFVASLAVPVTMSTTDATTIPLKLKSTTPLKGMSMTLALDPDQFEVVSIDAGPFLRQGDATVNVSSRQDKESKTLIIGALRSSPQGASGDDVALLVKVKPKAKGNFAIGLNGGSAIPENGSPLPVPRTAAVKIEVQ